MTVLPVVLSLLSASLPEWLTPADDPARFYAKRDPRAPQLANPKHVWANANARAEPALREGLIACRAAASVEVRWDAFADPDLLLTLELPGQAPLQIYGPETSYVMYATVPGVELRAGDKVRLMLQDRDVTGEELVGADVQIYGGTFPLRFSSAHFEAECRAMPPRVLAATIEAQLREVKKATSELERAARVDFDAADLGARSWQRPLERLSARLNSAAAYTGWEHEALGEALAAAQRTLDTWREGLVAPIEKKAAAVKPGPARWRSFELELLATRCGSECRFTVAVTNTGKQPLELAALDPLAMFSNGAARATVLHTNPNLNGRLPGGRRTEVELSTACGLIEPCPPLGVPRLLRFGAGQSATWLRL